MSIGPSGSKGKTRLSTFELTMITMSILVGVQLAPEVAGAGMTLVFNTVLAFLLFAVPAALVVSQVVTSDPRPGGVYSWAKDAFGEKWGFLGIWLQWTQAMVVIPALLAICGASALYALAPHLAQNRFFLAAFVVLVAWMATALNLRGMKFSARISTVGVLFGVAVPAALILALGIAWIATGRPEQIDLTLAPVQAIPRLGTTAGLSFLTVAFFLFVGTEISAAHILDVENPRRAYPIAIFSAITARAVVMIGTSLAVAIMVPVGDLSFVAGLMEALRIALGDFRMGWLSPLIGLLVAIGVFAQVSSLLVGPSRAIAASAQAGDIPPKLQGLNERAMPTPILVLQAVCISALALTFLVFPDVSDAFFILNQLAAQLYMTMYVLLFVTALVLFVRRPHVPGAFRIPGGRLGTWAACILGALSSFVAVVTGFFPPDQFSGTARLIYYIYLCVFLIGLLVAPLVIYRRRNPDWAPRDAT